MWGLGIMGPLTTAPGNRKFFLTTKDYFTNLPSSEWPDRSIKQSRLRWFEEKVGESKRQKAKGKWAEELPHVLWAYRTTPQRSTGETPFSLAYGMEAVIPLEVGLPTIRSENFDPDLNDEAITLELDLAEERREKTLVHIASYQQELSRKYNKTVHPRQFKIGDWVLRKVMGNTMVPGDSKLGPNWEGPYKVVGLVGKGAYHLEDEDGKAIPRPWNTANLKLFYF
ncbi:hypothetical protein CsSME_00014254 [Camellia sinensis var. sinensis]